MGVFFFIIDFIDFIDFIILACFVGDFSLHNGGSTKYMQMHFNNLAKNYGSQCVVNLIDHNGGEHLLGEEFEIQVIMVT